MTDADLRREPLRASPDILAAQEEIVEAFALFEDWSDRYQYIIDVGRALPEFPVEWKIEDNRLKGCQSQVWIVTELKEGRMHIHAVSDSAIVSGLIALLLQVYSDRKPADILATPPDFIRKIQLEEHLSPTRSNGLAAMVQQIRQFAVEALARQAG
ncbi:MAG: SufE family protein [Gammaproteobacteria bacterium]|nr:SufE family protein [Gammaproteobacteria bacterium]MBI5618092.1 SufE family protein [Gammaproteobacteria bacterium]